jgi:hypothetical protein
VKVDKAILSEIILEEVDSLIESGELDEGYWDALKAITKSTLRKDYAKGLGQHVLSKGLKGVGLSKAGAEAAAKSDAESARTFAQNELHMMEEALKALSALRKNYLHNLRIINAASRENEFDVTVIGKGSKQGPEYLGGDAQLGPYLEGFARNITRLGEWMEKTIEQAQIVAGQTKKGQDTSGTGLFRGQRAAEE